jgi:hypothetical protein
MTNRYAQAREAARHFIDLAARDYGPASRGLRAPFLEVLGPTPEMSQAVAEPLAALAKRMSDHLGDGCRTVVLIAAATIEAVLSAEPQTQQAATIAGAVRRLASDLAAKAAAGAKRAASPADLLDAATTAALGREEIGEAMLEAFRDAGKDGYLRVSIDDDPSAPLVRVEQEQGYHFPFGVGPAWPDHPADFNAYVFVTTSPVTLDEVSALAERFPISTCVCLCPAIDKPAWHLALHHHQHASAVGHHMFPVTAGAGPAWRELFEDAALLAGASVLAGLGKVTWQGEPLTYGFARCGLTADEFILHQAAVESPQRARQHNDALVAEMLESEDAGRKEWLCQRLARLTGGNVEILVHGASAEECAHLYDLTCNCLHATRAFVSEGGVPGGGATYAACASGLGSRGTTAEEQLAGRAFEQGLLEPRRVLRERAGSSAHHEPRLIDPARLVRMAITHAGEAVATALEALVR